VFPLLLLIIRRMNAVAMVAAVTLVVATVGMVGPHVAGMTALLTRSSPDLAALFAVGVMAAGILTANQRRKSWPWPWLALAAALPVIATISAKGSVWTFDHLFWVDLAFGPSIGCLLAAMATDRPASLVRALDTRPLRSLGSFSYSLYLTHAPIVVVVYEEIVAGRVRQGVPSFLVSLAIVLPVTIVFARLFAAVFEVPFGNYRGWEALRGSLMQRPAMSTRATQSSASGRAYSVRNPSVRFAGAHANQPSRIASRSGVIDTFLNWMRTAEYPSKWGIVKKALGCAASAASFSPRSSTRTARIGPSGGAASPKRLRSALLKGRSHANALPATDHVRLP
jgi:Acyltransferase family